MAEAMSKTHQKARGATLFNNNGILTTLQTVQLFRQPQ